MGRIGYYPIYSNFDLSVFNSNVDWMEFYMEVEEELPPSMPDPRGRAVSVYSFLDYNHEGNAVTRCSHTGIIMFIYNAPIIWFSKKQNTVEAATFGNELVALMICKYSIVMLRYNLQMFGVRFEVPAYVFCDNFGVVKIIRIP